jgi:hypothetical protein
MRPKLFSWQVKQEHLDTMTTFGRKKNQGSGKQAAIRAAYATTGNISRAAEIAKIRVRVHFCTSQTGADGFGAGIRGLDAGRRPLHGS